MTSHLSILYVRVTLATHYFTFRVTDLSCDWDSLNSGSAPVISLMSDNNISVEEVGNVAKKGSTLIAARTSERGEFYL